MSITDNLVGYWNLDEASGTRVDSSSNGNDLAPTGTPGGTTGPGSHNATTFDGSSQLLTRTAVSLNVGDIDFTFAYWVKWTTFVDYRGVAGQTATTGSGSWYLGQASFPPNRPSFNVSPDGTTTYSGWNAPTNISIVTGTWYFLVAYHDSVNNILSLKQNDTTTDSNSYSSGVFTATGTPFGIGCRDSGNYFNGAISMFGFWKRLLTATEQTNLYNSGNGRNLTEMLALEGPVPVPLYTLTELRNA